MPYRQTALELSQDKKIWNKVKSGEVEIYTEARNKQRMTRILSYIRKQHNMLKFSGITIFNNAPIYLFTREDSIIVIYERGEPAVEIEEIST